MERDAIIAHGASAFLLERLTIVSDTSVVWLCTACGKLATPPARDAYVFNAEPHCPTCNSRQHVIRHMLPWATALLLKELAGMSIGGSVADQVRGGGR